MQKLVFFCLSYLLLIQCQAQNHTVFNYSIKEGLPSSEVYYVLQDSKGFIWIATDNGVARFDGHEMIVFRGAEGLDDPVVFGIQEDHRGRIWFRTYSLKLFFFENGKIFPYRYNEVLSGNCVNIMTTYVDENDAVWFSSVGKWGVINSEGQLSAHKIPPGVVFHKAIGGGSISGVETGRGIPVNAINVDGKVFPLENPRHRGRSLYFGVNWKGKLYLSMERNIFELDGRTAKKIFTAPDEIISMYKDPEDQLWVGYISKGVQRFRDPDFKDPWAISVVKNKSVSKVLYDREGGIWITTLENGAFYIPDMAITNHYHGSSKVQSAVAFDRKVLFCTYERDISVFEENVNGPMSPNIQRFDGRIVSLVDNGLAKEVNAKELRSLVTGIFRDSWNRIWASHAILDFAEDKRRNILVFGEAFLGKFDHEEKLVSQHAFNVGLRNVLFGDSIIYVARRLGLIVYDTLMNERYAPAALAKMKISRMLSLNDTTLFVATVGSGFLLVNPRNWRFEQFTANRNFIANNVYTAAKKDAAIWMGTEKGVFVINTDSLIRRRPSFKQISMASGLMDDKVNILVFTTKHAWAFSEGGISAIPFGSARRISQAPRFYFKALVVNKQETTSSSDLQFPHTTNDITITFGYLSMKNQDITSRYRLTKNDEWTYTQDRSLHFFSLSPGQYTFELEYSTDRFHWISGGTPISFAITPPWWQRWYFQVLAALVFGNIIFFYLKRRNRRVYEQQQRLLHAEIEVLERERNRIAKELHDGVATNLSAIKLMVNQLLRSNKLPLAEEVDEHFVSTINEIKDIIYGLTPPGLEQHGLFFGLTNYIEKLNKTIPIRIQLRIVGPEIHKAELGILVFRIVQELLSNSVKHSAAENIRIHLHSFDDLLNVVFEDDGKGFTYDPAKAGLGLANIESRVQSVKGTLKFDSNSFGTSFVIDIPVTEK